MRGIHHLVLYNFKSYRGKHTIGPFKHFSAVVGPNGSGKSNVMDAITFVLGVSAGKIRAEQVKELINAYGPDDSTPNTSAYVEMDFEGSDGRRVTFRRSIRLVTRAVNAAEDGSAPVTRGETSYSVDGITVSKDEYQQRLAAIGITVRSSLGGSQSFPNFLVPQNEVALVAQKSPLQLAQYLDVISGSADYARAYEEAEAAMKAAEDEFMLAFRQRQTVTKEHKQVRELVEEARAFQEKLQEHALLKHEHYLVQLYYIDAERAKLKEESDALKARLAAAEVAAAEAAVGLEQRQQALADARRGLGKVERKRAEHTKAIADARPGAAKLAEQVKHLQKTVAECEAKQAKLAALRDERERAIKELEDGLAEVKSAQSRYEREATAAAAKSGGVTPAIMAEYQTIKTKVDEETAGARESSAALARQVAALKEKAALAAQTVAAVERNLATVVSSRAAAEARRAAAGTVAAETEAALATEREALAELEKKTKESGSKKERLLDQVASNQQRMADAEVDEVQIARLARLNDSLATLKALYPGRIRGRLSDLCHPTSPEYNRAVTVALGRHLDAIVVADDDTALKCIDYLKKQRAGIATFLPLASLRVTPPSDLLRRSLEGSLRLVYDAVTFDDVDKKAIMYACGNALVCKTLDEARSFQFGSAGARLRKTLAESAESLDDDGDDGPAGGRGGGNGSGQRFKIVTLDGSVLHKSGNMTGGTRARGSNDRFTDATVARLREETAAMVEELARLTAVSGSAAAEARSRQQQRVAALETKLSVAKDEVRRVGGELAIYDKRIQALQDDLADRHRPAVKTADAALAARSKELERAEASATATAAEKFAAFCKKHKVSSIKEWEQERLGAAQAMRERLGKYEIHVSRLEAQIKYERARADEEVAPMAALGKRAQQAKAEMAAALKGLRSIDATITTHEDALAALAGDFSAAEAAVAGRLEEFRAARAAVSAAEEAVAGARKAQSLLQLARSKAAAERADAIRRAVMDQVDLPVKRTGAASGGSRKRSMGTASPSKRRRTDDDEEEEEEGISASQSMSLTDSQSFPLTLDGSSSGSHPETSLGAAFGGTGAVATADVAIDYSKVPREAAISGLTTAEEVASLMARYQQRLQQLWAEIEGMSPNAHASEHEADVADKIKASAELFAERQQAQKRATERFEEIKATRKRLFTTTFNAVAARIDGIYKILSSTRAGGVDIGGGRAELALENVDEPYKNGVVYSATPPQKRFRNVAELSGGEKTMAALALLFAIHSVRNAPFFVLDEVDAALDQQNVSRVADYIKSRAAGSASAAASGAAAGGAAPLQCIVISHKDTLYSEAEALLGVYRNTDAKTSSLLTLDLGQFRGAEGDADAFGVGMDEEVH